MHTSINQHSQSLKVSTALEDIVAINERAVNSKTPVRIMELSSLGDLIPMQKAETIRQALQKRKVAVRQLTNQTEFGPWTEVDGFITTCMEVRSLPSDVLPIHVEILLFDDVVAVYRTEPQVLVTIIEEANFASQQRALFDGFWKIATPMQLAPDGSGQVRA